MNVLVLFWFALVPFSLLHLELTVFCLCTFRVKQWKQQTTSRKERSMKPPTFSTRKGLAKSWSSNFWTGAAFEQTFAELFGLTFGTGQNVLHLDSFGAFREKCLTKKIKTLEGARLRERG